MLVRWGRVLQWCLVLILAGACGAPSIAPGAGGAALLVRGKSSSVNPRPSDLPEQAPTATPAREPVATEGTLVLLPTREPVTTSTAPSVPATVIPSQAPPPTAVPPTALPLAEAVVSPTVPPLAEVVRPTPDDTARKLNVPILMYHYISVPPPNADRFRKDLSVSPDRFESHLAYLRDAGYHTISLDDLWYALDQGRPLPDKPIILTFDDGYADNYVNAFPLLRKYGVLGHFFLITDPIDQGNPQYMSWSQAAEMAAAGQYFGAHTRTHPDLRNRSTDFLVWQILGSTEAIQAHLGYRPHWAAYPSGRYDDRAIAVFRSANYWGCLTTEPGVAHSLNDMFRLTRLRVNGKTTAEGLKALLRAYQ